MIRPNKIAPNMYIRGAEMPRIIDLCPGFIQRILTNAQTQSPKRHMLMKITRSRSTLFSPQIDRGIFLKNRVLPGFPCDFLHRIA
jgi:hypothetical protein